MDSVLIVEESLLTAVGFDQGNLLVGTPGEAEIGQSFLVDGKDAACRAIFGGHVADSGSIGEREIPQSRNEILDELADNAVLSQDFRDGQHQVSSGCAFAQTASQLYPDDLRYDHGNRLPKHGSLGFDPAHAPAQHAEPVNHCCVRVGSDKGVGIGGALAVGLVHEDDSSQKFQIYLMDDAGVGRDNG